MVPQKLGRCEVYKRVFGTKSRAIQSLALRKKVFPLTVGTTGFVGKRREFRLPSVRTAYQRNDPIATPDVGFSRDALRGVVNREAAGRDDRTVLGKRSADAQPYKLLRNARSAVFCSGVRLKPNG